MSQPTQPTQPAQPAQSDSAPPERSQEDLLAAAEAQYQQSMQVFNRLIDNITPWLMEVGVWIFGGLIAFNLLIMGSLVTVGPVDLPIKLSTTAFALALPLNATGLVLLRFVQGLHPGAFEQEVARTFQEFGLTPGDPQIPTVESLKTMRERGTRVTRRFSLNILALSLTLTLAGLMTALWHMRWWISVAFGAMVLICVIIVIVAMVATQPPVSAEEKKRRRQRRDELLRQANERKRQAKRHR